MTDGKAKPAPPDAIPAWQQPHQQQQGGFDDTATQLERSSPDQLQVAYRFLQNDEVRAGSREKKVQFLRSKGMSGHDILSLLRETGVKEDGDVTHPGKADDDTEGTPALAYRNEGPRRDSVLTGRASHRPPIVTYPEFLTNPPKPPPLVTSSGLLATFYGFAGFATLLFCASKYYVAPAVENLTSARSELYGAACQRLQALVCNLEKAVSEVPARSIQPVAVEDASDTEDPTELFHRDVGTQTLLPAGPVACLALPSAKFESEHQADRLSQANKSLSALLDQLRAQTEDLKDIRTLIDGFQEDLDGMTYSGHSRFTAAYDMYGQTGRRVEPEDEIRRVRDCIRSVKGILLSTRNFPASTR
ncbi:hypothetical protein CDD83_5627 [Cordyceps sp. RAO-2017]|nr:hypothetical protein CDD83_5627 [Cordyceps sp. RAO-2017]